MTGERWNAPRSGRPDTEIAARAEQGQPYPARASRVGGSIITTRTKALGVTALAVFLTGLAAGLVLATTGDPGLGGGALAGGSGGALLLLTNGGLS